MNSAFLFLRYYLSTRSYPLLTIQNSESQFSPLHATQLQGMETGVDLALLYNARFCYAMPE